MLQRRDFVPFAALVDDGAPAVMVAHIDVRAVDPGEPSSLSHKVITGLLREMLGFQGLVVTDALDMAAVTQLDGSPKAAVIAVKAGADVLLMPADPKAAIYGLVAAVAEGTITKQRLQSSAAKTVALCGTSRSTRCRRPPPSAVTRPSPARWRRPRSRPSPGRARAGSSGRRCGCWVARRPTARRSLCGAQGRAAHRDRHGGAPARLRRQPRQRGRGRRARHPVRPGRQLGGDRSHRRVRADRLGLRVPGARC